jgi:hypothetical protein
MYDDQRTNDIFQLPELMNFVLQPWQPSRDPLILRFDRSRRHLWIVLIVKSCPILLSRQSLALINDM